MAAEGNDPLTKMAISATQLTLFFAIVLRYFSRPHRTNFSQIPQDMLGAKPLRESAVVQAKVASAEARWQSSRAYLMQALDAAWETASRGESPTLQQRAALRLAGVSATEQCREVVELAYHLAGGSAIFEDQGFERRLRDMHAVTQQVQGQFVLSIRHSERKVIQH